MSHTDGEKETRRWRSYTKEKRESVDAGGKGRSKRLLLSGRKLASLEEGRGEHDGLPCERKERRKRKAETKKGPLISSSRKKKTISRIGRKKGSISANKEKKRGGKNGVSGKGGPSLEGPVSRGAERSDTRQRWISHRERTPPEEELLYRKRHRARLLCPGEEERRAVVRKKGRSLIRGEKKKEEKKTPVNLKKGRPNRTPA